ncbi:MAG: sulfotransferase domain-containing protein [Bacteroidota bacterium]
MERRNIIWLASYPKSGNTWFRSFLSALFNEKEFDINDLSEGKIFSRRDTIDEVLDLDSTLLTEQELKPLQSKVYQYLSNQSDKNLFYKIHDAFVLDQNKKAVVPEGNTKCAIYFVRNPLDVVISFANHNSETIDTTIEHLANYQFSLGNEQGKQVKQPLLTWSEHFLSWTQTPNFPVYVLKYEDMLASTFAVFKNILEKLDLKYSDEEIQKAIEATSFEKLSKQESEKGFKEKNPSSPKFFNTGKSGTWKEKLTEAQINRIITDHGVVMKSLRYI